MLRSQEEALHGGDGNRKGTQESFQEANDVLLLDPGAGETGVFSLFRFTKLRIHLHFSADMSYFNKKL